MKILLLNVMTDAKLTENFRKYFPEEDVITEALTEGPAVIHNRVDEALAAPDTVRKVQQAERDGYDAVVFTCHGDPNLASARQAVRIPVLGAMQVGAHFCAMLGSKFSIIAPADVKGIEGWHEDNMRRYGLDSRLASVRTIAFGVSLEEVLDETSRKPLSCAGRTLVEQAAREAIAAIEQDGATALVTGCGGLLWLTREVESELADRGYDVPFINAIPLAIEVARALAKLRISHSPIAFPPPAATALPIR